MKTAMMVLLTLGLVLGVQAETCDPGLVANCNERQQGDPCKDRLGKIAGAWNLVATFPADVNLCTGFAKDCDHGQPGSCNGLETWSYTWEMWECVRADQVLKRQGCIRSVDARTGTGLCCEGTPHKGKTKPVAGLTGMSTQACGCKRLPPAMCAKCHAEGKDPERQTMMRPQSCKGCHNA